MYPRRMIAPLNCCSLESLVRFLLVVMLVGGIGVLATRHARGQADGAARPNIVIILADDLGFADLGCYGSEIETPVLDGLANHGLRFRQFYNTARCCPTRASLLTGLYQHQAGVGHMTGDRGTPAYQGYLNDRCVTIAEALGAAGYQTLMAGKWHVGSQPGQWPLDRGFDRYFGCPTGGGFYFAGTLERRNRFLLEADTRVPFPQNAYVTDLFTDYAIRYVQQAAANERPFLLYLAHIAPHWPLQAKPEDIEKYRGRYHIGWDVLRQQRFSRQQQLGVATEQWALSEPPEAVQPWESLTSEQQQDLAHRMAVYAAQVDCIDQNVGRLVDALKRLGQWDNTILFFLSDNGCSAEGGPGGFRRGEPGSVIGTDASYASAGLEWANVSDTPFRRFKQYTHEGGIASPLIVHWPAGIAARGQFRDHVAHVIDLWPTCLELAGVKSSSPDPATSILPPEGVSLVPAFANQPLTRRDALYWEHQGNRAVRQGDWKLVALNKQPWELYDLASDRSERRDLAAQHPERVAKLAALWQAWADRCGVEEF